MITIQKIICPVDFSELSRKSLQYANEFARLSQGKVFLVGVIENDPSITYSHGLEKERAEEEQKLASLIEEENMEGIVADYVIYEGFAESVFSTMPNARRLTLSLWAHMAAAA